MRWQDDLYLKKHLNPLFLQRIGEFFSLLSQAKDDPHLIEKTEKNLTRFLFRRLILPSYLARKPSKPAKCFFLTVVHPDGVGDYFATLKAAKLVKEKIPQLEIELAYTHLLGVPQIDPKEYLLTPSAIHGFHETPDNPILEPVLSGTELPFEQRLSQLGHETKELEAILGEKGGETIKPLTSLISDYKKESLQIQALSEEKKHALLLYEAMKKSALIIHISLAINTFDNHLLASKSFYFAEAGNFQGIANYLQRNFFSLGLDPFEEGLFLNTRPSKLPPKKESVYVAYLTRTPAQRLLFIYLVCLLEQQKNNRIEIVFPRLSYEELSHLNLDWMKKRGVSQVIRGNETVAESGNEGKPLILLEALPLPPQEFEQAIAESENLMGCTGDGSFADCLSFGKIPFFELRPHKRKTWESLAYIAEHLEAHTAKEYIFKLANFEKEAPESLAEKLYEAFTAKGFEKEWEAIRGFIYKYCDFAKALLSHVQRHLLHSENPALKAFEEELFEGYFNKNTSSERVIHLLEKQLNNH
jgi:hypothetical protein